MRDAPVEGVEMTADIYTDLRDRIDQYSTGFRTTASGVELKILEKLFTEEEAAMYMNLTSTLQTAQAVAETTGQDPLEVEAVLQKMTEKGLTFPRFPKRKGEPFYYAAAAWAHGIIEHQLKRIDGEMAELYEAFLLEGWSSRGPMALRNIPVETAIDVQKSVAPYDSLPKVIETKQRIALADCLCQVWQRKLGKTYDSPIEVCMLFDFYADYYVEQGYGRWISQEEALAVLKESEKAGLVPQLSNSENPEALCNCQVDCCGQLRLMKQIPVPGLIAASNYYARVDTENCEACGICTDRCPMDAITMDADEMDAASIERGKCIGCGLCVSTCPTGALILMEKPEAERQIPPKQSNFMPPSEEFETGIA